MKKVVWGVWAMMGAVSMSWGVVHATPAAADMGMSTPVAAIQLVQAREGRDQQPRGRQRHQQRMPQGMVGYSHIVVQQADELGLTDEQLGSVMRLQRQHQEERAGIRSRLRAAMTATSRTLLDPTVDKEGVDAHVEAHAEAFQEWADNMWTERGRVLEILTDEQRETLEEQLAEVTPEVPEGHPSGG